MTKDDKTRCTPSLYMCLLKLTVNVPSCFTCFNNKNDKYFVCTTLELRNLESPDLFPLRSLEHILQSLRLSLSSHGVSWQSIKTLFQAEAGLNEQECHKLLVVLVVGKGGKVPQPLTSAIYDMECSRLDLDRQCCNVGNVARDEGG